MNGGNLHDNISCKTEALPWAERVQMSMDVAKAMSYLHSEGLFHRDLTSRVCEGAKTNSICYIGIYFCSIGVGSASGIKPLVSAVCNNGTSD